MVQNFQKDMTLDSLQEYLYLIPIAFSCDPAFLSAKSTEYTEQIKHTGFGTVIARGMLLIHASATSPAELLY